MDSEHLILWGGVTHAARVLGNNLNLKQAKTLAKQFPHLRYFEITHLGAGTVTSGKHFQWHIPTLGTLHWIWWR